MKRCETNNATITIALKLANMAATSDSFSNLVFISFFLSSTD